MGGQRGAREKAPHPSLGAHAGVPRAPPRLTHPSDKHSLPPLASPPPPLPGPSPCLPAPAGLLASLPAPALQSTGRLHACPSHPTDTLQPNHCVPALTFLMPAPAASSLHRFSRSCVLSRAVGSGLHSPASSAALSPGTSLALPDSSTEMRCSCMAGGAAVGGWVGGRSEREGQGGLCGGQPQSTVAHAVAGAVAARTSSSLEHNDLVAHFTASKLQRWKVRGTDITRSDRVQQQQRRWRHPGWCRSGCRARPLCPVHLTGELSTARTTLRGAMTARTREPAKPKAWGQSARALLNRAHQKIASNRDQECVSEAVCPP